MLDWNQLPAVSKPSPVRLSCRLVKASPVILYAGNPSDIRLRKEEQGFEGRKTLAGQPDSQGVMHTCHCQMDIDLD